MLQLTNRSLIKISGDDARNFLQGLITNDINKLTEKKALYAALQTPQGKYLFDFILYEKEGAIILDVAADRADELLKKLSIYKLRSKVVLEKQPDLKVYAGEKGVYDPRSKELGKRLVTPEHFVDTQSFDDYEKKRLQLGVPDTADLIPEKSFILQNHFELFHGVDFNKGCYVGQEIVARTKYKGTITRQLFKVKGEGALPANGTEIVSGGKVVGEMRSSLGNIGLAQVEVDAVLPGNEYSADGVKLMIG